MKNRKRKRQFTFLRLATLRSFLLREGREKENSEMVVNIPYRLVSHTRKICDLYKRWLRNIEAHTYVRHEFRYEATLARAKFDALMAEKDMIKAKQMIEDMEEELFKNFDSNRIYFPNSPGGVCYGRQPVIPDYVLDFWHPLEKAAYPSYFAKREIRKQQYIEMWERQYAKCEEKEKKK